MSVKNQIVAESTENIGGLVVVTRQYDGGAVKFYIQSADGGLTPLAKKAYFSMLEKQAPKESAVAKTVREQNSIKLTFDSSNEMSKVDWYEYNQLNSRANEKAQLILDKVDSWVEIPDYINYEDDKVFVGGWLYQIGEVIGFISHHLKSKSNLDVTLYEDGSMPHWEQPKREWIVNLFKHIPGLEPVGDVVSDYYVTPELSEEDTMKVALGQLQEQDLSNYVQVYEDTIFGINVLVHWITEEEGVWRVYFVEQLEAETEEVPDEL